MLRSVAAAFDDRTQITDELAVQYGVTLDALPIAGRANQSSPYARLSYTPERRFGNLRSLSHPEMRGPIWPAPPTEDADLQHDLNTLGLIPRISALGGRARIQRGAEYEMAYARKAGSRRYELSAYREVVTNAALSMVAPAGMYSGGDILPDLFTGNSIFNAGDYRSYGLHGLRHADAGRPDQRHADAGLHGRADRGQPRDCQPQSGRAPENDSRRPKDGRDRARGRHPAGQRHPRGGQLPVDRPQLGHAGPHLQHRRPCAPCPG